MEEPNTLVRWTIFVFASGEAAFLGAFLVATVVALGFHGGRVRTLRPMFVAAALIVGLILIACGSPVVPVWFQILTVIWIIYVLVSLRAQAVSMELRGHAAAHAPRLTVAERLRFFSPFLWLLTGVAIELPYWRWSPPAAMIQKLLVIGDSVTAGLNDGEETWPRHLSQMADVAVSDASQPGATLRSARQQHRLLADQSGLSLLEIGGNDLLAGLPVVQFEADLSELLADVTRSGQPVVMFELPLPPLCSAYCAAQRRQAGRYHVTLIPKRLFIQILTSRGATVDGIHLSAFGQQQMMQCIRQLFGDRLRAGRGTWQRFERTSNGAGS
jgi:lysophospholipase L1-like esterase